MVDLRGEISVIVCRLNDENVQTFDPAENIHENGILAYSIVPARLSADIQQQARQMAQRLTDELNYIGVLAVEMFVVGDTHELVVNEIAPRPHNSGHHTIDACAADQFQQQVRLMCNLPPADTKLLTSCCMANILGDVWKEDGNEPEWLPLQSNPNAHLHLYGKKPRAKAEKMGHFTVLANDADNAFQTAQTFTSKPVTLPTFFRRPLIAKGRLKSIFRPSAMSLLTILRPATEKTAKLYTTPICMPFNTPAFAVMMKLLCTHGKVCSTSTAIWKPSPIKTKPCGWSNTKGLIQGFFKSISKKRNWTPYTSIRSSTISAWARLCSAAREEMARNAGLSFLKLYASLNSVPFYRLNRYESLGTAVLQLNKTVRVECELMRKYL